MGYYLLLPDAIMALLLVKQKHGKQKPESGVAEIQRDGY